MSFLVHFVVSFPCTDNEPLAELAREHLAFINGIDEEAGDESDVSREVFWFLTHLSERTGRNPGSKGGMVTWGAVGNYTMMSRFIETLANFWDDLYNKRISDFADHDYVLILEQGEDAWAKVYEVYCKNKGAPPGKRQHSYREFIYREGSGFGWRGVV